MQTLTYRFPADRTPVRQVHVGVVAAGDLEILLDPSADSSHADVRQRQGLPLPQLIEARPHDLVRLSKS